MKKDYISAAVKPISEESIETRRELARDPKTPERTLHMLAEDEDVVVRTLVALNSNTPEDLVEYLKDGHVLPENGIEVVYWDYDWDPRDHMDKYSDDAVILGAEYDFTDAEWWDGTISVLSDLWDLMSSAENYDEFLLHVKEEYDDYYDESRLRSLYNLYENYGYSSDDYYDEDFTADAVEIVYPDLHIDQTRIYGPQYGNRGRESAYVIYDRDEIDDIDELADWYFGNVYETREYSLDINNIPTDTDLTVSEMYYEYGYDSIYSNMFTDTERTRMEESGDVQKAVAEYCGYHRPGECYVFGDI